MYGYIYKTTNLINNKIYIGQHKAEKYPSKNYIGSGVLLEYAIKKYGIENFKNELLCECNNQQELDEKEQYYININNSTNRLIGYNIQAGGNLNPTTTQGHVQVTKHNKDHLIDASLVEEYLNDGYTFGRSHKQIPWSKGQSKTTNKILNQISDTRKKRLLLAKLLVAMV